MQAFFILGSHRHIARAELGVVVALGDVTVDVDDVVIAEVEQPNLSAIQAQTGGIIKTGLIHATAKDQKELVDVLAALVQTLRPGENKVRFGVSVYTGGSKGKMVALRSGAERLGLQVKGAIKSDRGARLVTSKVPVLSSVIVKKQRLLDDGIEFCLFPRENDILVGVTETVQDFETWGERDYGRPDRDAVRGMLPPKLARMMVNLSEGDPATHTLLDPFCGVGTVLTEAIDLGYTKVIGSDADEVAVEATRKNVLWEATRKEETITPQLIRSRAESLNTFLAPASVDRLVSELDLGPPCTGEETREELEGRLEKLTEMYTEALRSLQSVMSPGAVAVIAVPAYVLYDGTIIGTRIVDRASLFGFLIMPWEQGVSSPSAKAMGDLRGALRYGREGQFVWRDIYRFIKK